MKIKENYHSSYSPVEEKANVITHFIGIILGFGALFTLIFSSLKTSNSLFVLSSIIFGVSLIVLYSASTFYHACKGKSHGELGSAFSSKKRILRVIDHSAIYILIAGSYTPLLLIPLGNSLGIVFCIFMWCCAFFGILFKVYFVNSFKILSTLMYVGMGWAALFVIKPLYYVLSKESFYLILIGGLCYTGGLTFYFWKKLPFHHAVWHVFVIAGSACHFFSVFLLLKSMAIMN